MIVAIARQFGAGANRVARLVADALGYELIHDQLPEVLAVRMETTPDEVRVTEGRPLSFGERLLRSLQAGTPEVVGPSLQSVDEDVVREVERLVREYAGGGNCVMVGHGSAHILRGRSDVLTVLVHGSAQWRAQRVADWWKVSIDVARREVERVDRARRSHVLEYYGVDPRDIGLYDLIVDTEALGFEAAAAAVLATARAKSCG